MSKPQFVYVTHIKTTPEQLWEALRDPELTRRYWSRHRNASDWQVGSKWEHQNYDDSTITKLATADLSVLQVLATNEHPIGITYEASKGRIWVAGYAGSLQLYDDE